MGCFSFPPQHFAFAKLLAKQFWQFWQIKHAARWLIIYSLLIWVILSFSLPSWGKGSITNELLICFCFLSYDLHHRNRESVAPPVFCTPTKNSVFWHAASHYLTLPEKKICLFWSADVLWSILLASVPHYSWVIIFLAARPVSEASELLDTIGGAALPRCDLMLCDGPRPHQSIYGYNVKIIGSTGLQFTHGSTGTKTAANRRQREGKLKCTSCIVGLCSGTIQ